MTVDREHVYWTDTDAGTIGRAVLDGTDVAQDFLTGASVPGGVALDGAAPTIADLIDSVEGLGPLCISARGSERSSRSTAH